MLSGVLEDVSWPTRRTQVPIFTFQQFKIITGCVVLSSTLGQTHAPVRMRCTISAFSLTSSL